MEKNGFLSKSNAVKTEAFFLLWMFSLSKWDKWHLISWKTLFASHRQLTLALQSSCGSGKRGSDGCIPMKERSSLVHLKCNILIKPYVFGCFSILKMQCSFDLAWLLEIMINTYICMYVSEITLMEDRSRKKSKGRRIRNNIFIERILFKQDIFSILLQNRIKGTTSLYY